MSPRTPALALCALLLAAAVPTLTHATDDLATQAPHLVFAPDVDQGTVVDRYGPFVTALLTGAQAAALRERGIAAEPLDLAVHRGAWSIRGDDAMVPQAMRAGPLDPFFVVQFRGPVKEAWRAALEAEALAVHDSLPNFAFVAKLAPGAAARLAALAEVAFVGPYHPAYKLSPDLPAAGLADVAVLVHPGEPVLPVAAHVALLGGEVRVAGTTAARDGVVKAALPVARLAEVARLAAVSWIEPSLDGITLDNAQASAITQTGTLTSYKLHDKGVDGSTQVLSVCDTGVKTDGRLPTGVREMRHEMYDDPANPFVVFMVNVPPPVNQHRKMAMYYAPLDPNNVEPGGDFDDTNGHGTHTAGTITGDAPPYAARGGNDGLAFAGRLAVCDITNGSTFFIAADYSAYWDPAYNAGARVNSNSWGSTHTTSYTDKARQHDAYVWGHRDFVILRSMGNTGGNTIRPEAVAKDALGIGAGNNGAGMESLASFSSRGPTQDGRVKPNVIAPGACLNSAGTGTNNYVCFSGTSMSTPTVAGAVGLIRDYFAKGFYPSGEANNADSRNPSAALVRALLEGGAKRITGSLAGTGFPNGNQGWGRALLDDTLFFKGDSRGLFLIDEAQSGNLSTGDTRTYTLTVGAGQPLRVMLAWTDQAGAAGANPAIVNDLDLEVSGPAGTYKGNAFVGFETPPNQGARDSRNVEEQVLVASPAAGTYTVTVRATNVPSGPQPFALVAASA